MPTFGYRDFQKKRSSAKGAYSSTKRYSKISSARAPPSTVPAAVKLIKDVINNTSEKKEVQTYLSQTDLATQGFLLLNGVAEGDSEITRDGKLIHMDHLVVNVAVAVRTTSTNFNSGFWAIILDRQPNGADPTVTGVYDTTYVTDIKLAPRNNANLQRYKVLMRKDFDLTVYTGGNSGQSWQEYINLKQVLKDEKDQLVRYSGSGATITSIRTNSIYLIYAISGQSRFADATNYAQITGGFKFAFTDH